MYVTLNEFKNAPTGIDPLSVIPGGTQAQCDAELTNVIMRASAWVNQYCQQQTLEATVNTEIKEVTMNHQGLIRVHPNNIPIIELVDSVQYRVTPTDPWIPLSIEYIQTYNRYFTIHNLKSTVMSHDLSLMYPAYGYSTPGRMKSLQQIPITLKYTYVNGYTHTFIKNGCASGGLTIDLVNPAGTYEGQMLTIFDNEKSETVTVESVNGNTIKLASALVFAHADNTHISALPATVKQAAILMCAYFIKERGALTISMGQTTPQGSGGGSFAADLNMAKLMLQKFKRGITS